MTCKASATAVAAIRPEEEEAAFAPRVNNVDRLAAFLKAELGRNAHEAWFQELKLECRRNTAGGRT